MQDHTTFTKPGQSTVVKYAILHYTNHKINTTTGTKLQHQKEKIVSFLPLCEGLVESWKELTGQKFLNHPFS